MNPLIAALVDLLWRIVAIVAVICLGFCLVGCYLRELSGVDV